MPLAYSWVERSSGATRRQTDDTGIPYQEARACPEALTFPQFARRDVSAQQVQKATVPLCLDLLSWGMRSCFSAGYFRGTAGAIDAADGPAVRCRVARDIKIYRLARFQRQLRIPHQNKPRNPVERHLGFVP